MNRRSLITGSLSFLAAPAIVRAGSLMPIRGDVYRFWEWRMPLLPPIPYSDYNLDHDSYRGPNGRLYEGIWTFFGKDRNIYSDAPINFEKREYPA